MNERNYWTSLRDRKISRRTMLQASGRAGVGVAGLALVGCGDDDDDDDDATVATEQSDEQAEEQAQAQAEQQPEERAQAERGPDGGAGRSAGRGPGRTGRARGATGRGAGRGLPLRQDTRRRRHDRGYYGRHLRFRRRQPERVQRGLAGARPDSIEALAIRESGLGRTHGDLASGWEAPDGQTVVLQLREGVKWHAAGPGADHPASTAGRPLTAEDLAWNIERQKAGLLQDGSEGAFGRKATGAALPPSTSMAAR